MSGIAQLLLAGLATGGVYALAAIGFTMVWQTSNTVNFAQGEFVMVPAFFMLAAMKFLGLPFWAAVIVGIAISVVVLGVLFKRLMVDPMLGRGVLPLVIATLGLSLLIKESVKIFYATTPLPFPALVAEHNLAIGGAVVSLQSVVILAVAAAAVAALQLFLARTRTGRYMQATAQNMTVARLLGVPVERMILYTFMINAALVALASILVSPIYFANYSNGETLGLAAFTASIVGGFNQVRGAMVGGLLFGVIDNFSAVYISQQYRSAVPLLILIVVILFRPQGLLGRIEERTV